MAHGMVQFPGEGCIVEFLQGNGPQIAWVLEENSGKLRLLLPNRRETNLPQSRLLPWSGPVYSGVNSRDTAIGHLNRHKDLRAEIKKRIDVRELWEMAQGEVARASAVWFAELTLSDPDIDTVAACGQALLECKSHFKFQPPDFEIFSEAAALQRLNEQEAQRLREDLARQGNAWLAHLWDRHSNRQVRQTPAVSPEVAERLRALILRKLADPESSEDESQWKLLVKGLPDEPMLPLLLAQAWEIVPRHYNYWLERADYLPGDDWAGEHGEAVRSLVDEAGRSGLPCVDIPFVSIDSASTRDIDDALHVVPRSGGGWIATLALACPALNWPFGSELDKAVLHRATSVYLPEAVHHMLPEILSLDAFTLSQADERPALLVECHVSTDGAIERCLPSEGTIRIRANLTYEGAETLLAGQERACPPYAVSLLSALDLCRVRQAFRLRNNAVIIDRPEPQLLVACSDAGDPLVTLEDEAPAPLAHLVVSELMILANAALATWAGERNVALLHRTQDVTVPKDYAGIWSKPEEIARVVRVLVPASLEVTPRPHAGLGEKAYAPSTSPLRRYPDLLNEAQILHVLRTGAARWSKEQLESMLPLLNSRLDAASQVQRMRPRYWKLLYLKQNSTLWWPGVVTDENDAFVSVSLPREQVFLRAKRSLFGEKCHPGQAVEVKLHKIHPLRNEVQIADVREP